jgi:hypothetical protein
MKTVSGCPPTTSAATEIGTKTSSQYSDGLATA